MSYLTETSFNNLIVNLRDFYGDEETKAAMNELIQFYKTEFFDNEDITNDWIANDFQNSHGIHVFIEKLNYPNKVNNPTNKEILFEWFCHWLCGTQKPNQPPIHPIANNPPPGFEPFTVDRSRDPIETVAKKFEFQLKIKINSLKKQPQIANSMAESFMTICKNDDYTELDELESDLESVEDSFIIGELIRQYSQYSNRKELIFYMLQHIVSMLKYDNYPPFHLSRFKCKFSQKTFERANKLCMHFIPSFFKNKVAYEELKTSQISDKKDNKDLQLMNGKALDFENNFPLLINLFDAYSRFRADSNEMFWKTTEMTPKSDKQNKHISVTLKANEWWTQKKYCGFAQYLKEQNECIYVCLANALAATAKRPLPLFNFNHVVGETIFDSYDIFTRYTCAFNAFLHGLLREENGTVPFQIDLWIIPRLSKTGIHHDHQLPDDFNDVKMDFLSDDENDDDTTMADMMSGKIQELGKNEGTGGEDGKIWNIEDRLMEDEYKLGDDYWRYPEKAFGDTPENISMSRAFKHPQLVRNFINLFELYTEYIHKKNDDISYKRFILVIDRRDPKHIDNKKMDDEKINNDQTWYDRMYLIRPKKYTMDVNQKKSKNKDGNNNGNEKPIVYRDEICKLYDFTMNETFIGNTMEYLFPMAKLQSHEYRYDFSGLDSGNGYKFVISYHVHFCNKVKMYWYFGQGAIRFFMNDICWLWPRYFNPCPADDKNTSESFQTLTRDGKLAMENAIKDYPLIDKQYKQFKDQLATFAELITTDH